MGRGVANEVRASVVSISGPLGALDVVPPAPGWRRPAICRDDSMMVTRSSHLVGDDGAKDADRLNFQFHDISRFGR